MVVYGYPTLGVDAEDALDASAGFEEVGGLMWSGSCPRCGADLHMQSGEAYCCGAEYGCRDTYYIRFCPACRIKNWSW